MPSRQRRLSSVLVAASLAAGCSSTPYTPTQSQGLGGKAAETAAKAATSLIGGPIIPDTTVNLGPSVAYPLEKLVYWGAWIGAAWLIIDPLSPNWEIQEARLPENHVHFLMSMKRYYAGGAGEARVVFHRRAKDLMRAGGFTGYEVIEYSEGMDSSMIGSQRTAEGVIRLTRKAG